MSWALLGQQDTFARTLFVSGWVIRQYDTNIVIYKHHDTLVYRVSPIDWMLN